MYFFTLNQNLMLQRSKGDCGHR